MQTVQSSKWARNAVLRAGAVAGVLALAAGLSACEDILKVDLPGSVAAESLEDPKLAKLLVTSAVADFECAFNNYVMGTAVHGDEFWQASGGEFLRAFGQRRASRDAADFIGLGGCEAEWGIYRTLHTARFQARDAFEKVSNFSDAAVPDKSSLLAAAAAYEGYSLTLLAEAFCEITIDAGPVLKPSGVLAQAEERLARAIDLATSAGNSDILNMARLGRARVRLNLGKKSEAIADAKLVPDGFIKFADRGPEAGRGRWNDAFEFNVRDPHTTVHPRYRNLTWDGVPDPRVPVLNTGKKANDRIADLWIQQKYKALDSDVPMAKWDEAQLIIAEASLPGDRAEPVRIINELHRRAGIPATFAGTDPDVILGQVLEERKRALWLEGRRLNDMLRFLNQPVRHELSFLTSDPRDPTGALFGTETCFELPLAERAANPRAR